MGPLVSIVLPTFNRSEYLIKAIESVIFQTYENWELIVWDDGSTDNSRDIVIRFHDERIKYFWHENKGPSFARNNAIKKSIGKYIAFLDSDDCWLPRKLSSQVNIMESYLIIDILFSNYENVNITTGKKTLGFYQNRKGIGKLKTANYENDLFVISDGLVEGLLTSNFISTDSMIIKREIIEQNKFDEGLQNAEDLELWVRLGLQKKTFAYSNDIFLVRNKPKNSLSSPSLNNYFNLLQAYDLCNINLRKCEKSLINDYLKNSFRDTWLKIANQYLTKNSFSDSWAALKRSSIYGFSFYQPYLYIKSLFLLIKVKFLRN